MSHALIVLSRFNCVQLFATLWTVARQAPLPMGFSRQEYWSGLPFSSPRDLPDPRIEPSSLKCPVVVGSFFFFFPFIFISWRLVTLQYCNGFCHTLTWISHGFTCVPHPDPPSHLPLHPIPLGLPVHQARALVSCIQPGLVFCFTLDNIHVSMLFSQNIPPSPSPTESKSLFCTSVSLVVTITLYAKQKKSSRVLYR